MQLNVLNCLSAFLAHLWGAYAIPVVLSGVRHVSSVSTITTRNNKDIKPIFGVNVHHVPGLCLLGIGGAPYISHKIMAQKTKFSHFRLLLRNHQQMVLHITLGDSLDLGHYNLLKL